ncbi:MAG: MerR family DNA-binding transcriptional regulator [Chloroflexi bacterium]|nr:MerR family DNA-binding transcriptional regulator [Chloroflexota bacterium]
MSSEKYTTKQVAHMAGIHRDTLLRWLREGRITEPSRDRNGWRKFTREEAQAIVHFAWQINGNTAQKVKESDPLYLTTPDAISRLAKIDWDFADASTSYLTHAIHPYPAKYIPQIPKALIRELASIGDTVLDPFCGSGTTLVEALRLECNAVGIDANPLACLISRAKTTVLREKEIECLKNLAEETGNIAQQAFMGTLPLFPDLRPFPQVARPGFAGVEEWFDPPAINELAFIKEKCLALNREKAKRLALTAFSSIIVTVSRQDSDTRYVRRQKNIKPGDTLQLFSRALSQAIQRVTEFGQEVDNRFTAIVHEANILEPPEIEPVDLVVCSPPYPNAYSYHLYHRTRMLWLDMDQPKFKQEEIGSHRKYSRKGKNAATADTFRGELFTILSWLSHTLKHNRYACFVIGDSTIKGERVHNDQLLIEVAEATGYQVEANLTRHLQAKKKSFNPAIGKIKDEHIVILRNSRNKRRR